MVLFFGRPTLSRKWGANIDMKGTSASQNAGVSARELRVRCNPRNPSGIWEFGIRVALSGARPPQQKMQQEALQNTAWQRTTAMYRGYLWDLNEQPLAPPRNDRPCRRRGRRCLLTPSTANGGRRQRSAKGRGAIDGGRRPASGRVQPPRSTRGASASRNAGVSARELRVRCNPRVPSGIWGFEIRLALSFEWREW